jgi:hypothetical protein
MNNDRVCRRLISSPPKMSASVSRMMIFGRARPTNFSSFRQIRVGSIAPLRPLKVARTASFPAIGGMCKPVSWAISTLASPPNTLPRRLQFAREQPGAGQLDWTSIEQDSSKADELYKPSIRKAQIMREQPWSSASKSRRTDMVKFALGILALSLTASVGLAEEMTVATPDAIKWGRLHPFLPEACNSP